MPTFQQMGGVPNGYGDILNNARQNLVKLPNGSYALAPQMGGATSVEEIYRGIIPSSQPSPISPTGAGPGSYGNLVGFLNDPIYGTQPQSSGTIRTAGQAGNVAMPRGVTPASVQQAFAQMAQQPSNAQRSALAAVPPGSKDQSRLTAEAPLGPKAMPALNTQGQIVRNVNPMTNAYGPVLGSTQNPALAAIQQATGMAPSPMSRPLGFYGQPQAASQANNPVGMLQQQLASKGFNPGAIDGVMGQRTDSAIRAFQKANGLKVDGIVGPKTLAALNGQAQAQSQPIKTKSGGTVTRKASTSSSSKPSGFGSKGYSEAGKALRAQFGL